ncbi:MAG: hypothetical protein KatS3mg114_0242 [Planctomycetaceae bacterium]|nr:MAG: hypothetical protein KatS3mg114_0242 [Planctomycetaceae bacterium]
MSQHALVCFLGGIVMTLGSIGSISAEDPVLPFPPGPAWQRYTAEELEDMFRDRPMPEVVKMYLSILRGGRMGDGEGWFGPAQSRYHWPWLAARHQLPPEQPLTRERFLGPPEWFPCFDRTRDGQITADELDWSSRNPWVQQAYMINRLFRKIDPTGDGRLTRAEWLAFFDRVAGDKESLTSDDLRDEWLSGIAGGFLPGDAPSRDTLLRALFAGEVGSWHEGPALDQPAPDFELSTHDGQRRIRAADLWSEKPLVLVFGNFTCGPFRSMYPAVDEVAQRHRALAHFLLVYVREAHPTDGWAMSSNTSVGVAVPQPQSYNERCAVAGLCFQRLQPIIPMVVDALDDRVGHAYSGMPARLYVIDRQGRVAYKSGRGPFGFKVREMEQALLMLLLDQSLPATANSSRATAP